MVGQDWIEKVVTTGDGGTHNVNLERTALRLELNNYLGSAEPGRAEA
jgi:hypothetical protein